LTAAFNIFIQNFTTYVLSFAAGNFIYVAASDLIPELTRRRYNKNRRLRIATQIVAVAFGTMNTNILSFSLSHAKHTHTLNTLNTQSYSHCTYHTRSLSSSLRSGIALMIVILIAEIFLNQTLAPEGTHEH
jgi:hypothetical protein